MVMRPVRFNKVRIFALCVAAVIWLPCVLAIYRGRSAGFVSRSGLSTEARALMVHQRALWDDPVMRRREVEPMRRSNPEWDFMGRSKEREPDQDRWHSGCTLCTAGQGERRGRIGRGCSQ